MTSYTQLAMLILVAVLLISGYRMTRIQPKGTSEHQSGKLFMLTSVILFMILVDSKYNKYNIIHELSALFEKTYEIIDM